MSGSSEWVHLGDLGTAFKKGRLVPCVGPRVSLASLPELPSIPRLLSQLLDLGARLDYITPAEVETIATLLQAERYLTAAEELKYRFPADTYHHFMVERFDQDAAPSRLHQAIIRLHLPLVLTTNFDHLLEDAYAVEFRRSPRVLTYKNASDISDFLDTDSSARVRRTIIWKLHGTIEDPATIVLSEKDYQEILHQPQYRDVLTEIFGGYTIIFVGYELSDASLKWIVNEARQSLIGGPPHLFATALRSELTAAASAHLSDLGIQALEMPGARTETEEIQQLFDALASLKLESDDNG